MGLESRLELLKKPDIEIRDTPTYLRAMERANRFDLLDGSVAAWIGENLSYVAQHYPDLLQFEVDGSDLTHFRRWESPDVTVHVRDYVVHDFDGAELLMAWARYSALSVKDVWPVEHPIPEVVECWLRTGDESIRDEAREATYRASYWTAYMAAYRAYSATHSASCGAVDRSAYWAAYRAAYGAIQAGASETELLAQLRRMLLESLQGKAEWSWK